MNDLDARVRLAAFAFLEEQSGVGNGLVARDILVRGFTFEEQRVPLASAQGIFKPRILV